MNDSILHVRLCVYVVQVCINLPMYVFMYPLCNMYGGIPIHSMHVSIACTYAWMHMSELKPRLSPPEILGQVAGASRIEMISIALGPPLCSPLVYYQ